MFKKKIAKQWRLGNLNGGMKKKKASSGQQAKLISGQDDKLKKKQKFETLVMIKRPKSCT